MPTRDILNFITSGRMSSLRELSIAIEYKDWVRFHPLFTEKRLTSTSIISCKDSLKFLISAL